MSEFIKRILGLEEDNTNLRAKIECLSGRGIEDMQDQVAELEAENNKQEGLLEDYADTEVELRGRIAELTEQNKAINEVNALSLQEKRERIAELEANEAQLEVYLSESRDKVRELEQRIKDIIEAGLNDAYAMGAKVAELEAELATLQWINVEDELPVPNDDWDIQIYDTKSVCLVNLGVSYTNDTPKYYNYGKEFTLKEIKCDYTHWRRNVMPEEEPKENSNE